MISGTAYINQNTNNFSPMKSTLKTTGSSIDTAKKSVGYFVYVTNNVEAKYRCHKEKYGKYPCSAGYQRIAMPTSDVCLFVKSNARSVSSVI